MVHERILPRPLTGTHSKSGVVLPQCWQTTSGGWVKTPHTEHLAMLSVWSAAAAQYPADCASGTGAGPTAAVKG